MGEDDPRREALEQELKSARESAAETRKKLQTAQAAAEVAAAAQELAEASKAQADSRLMSARAAHETASRVTNEVNEARDAARANAAAAQNARDEAESGLKAQQDAQAERARLDSRRQEADATLSAANASLLLVQSRIASLEAEAEPRRGEFQRELALVRAGEQAQRDLEEARRERGRYQGVSDEISLRVRDRAELQKEHDTLKSHHLVQSFDQLVAEEAELAARTRALEFLRVRAFAEDEIFAHKQKAALERFREADREARRKALKVLNAFCPPYAHEAYNVITGADEPDKLRHALLNAMWTFYYNAGLEETDNAASESYYVLVQSRAPQDAFNRLDARWRTYLGEALGRQGFDRAGALSRHDLNLATEE
jgi:hypothetical protein